MKLKNGMLWAVAALGILGSTTNVYSHCLVTPDSILTLGQTLQLVADCTGVDGDVKLKSIDWQVSATNTGAKTSMTGVINLDQETPKKVYYTLPEELTLSRPGEYWFSVAAVDTNLVNLPTSDRAKVVIRGKTITAAISATASGRPAVDGACGPGGMGGVFTGMPPYAAQCTAGQPALAITGPTSFSWSCLGRNGGLETNCYGVRGFTVTATNNGSTNGSISPASQIVAAGDEAKLTAEPKEGFSPLISGCNGDQSGNTFEIEKVTKDCTVTASFTDLPTPGICGSQSASLTQPGQCSAGSFVEVPDTPEAFKWNCSGTNGGNPGICSAPKQYTVSATVSGSGGTINTPTGGVVTTSNVVTHDGYTTFTVTPTGTNVASATGCGAMVSGNTITTGAITGSCPVTVSFAAPQTGITCNGVTMPGTVNEINTGLPDTSFPYTSTTYETAPVDTVYSFKFTVPSSDEQKTFSTTVIKTTAAPGTRYMVISSCRGDYITANKTTGCFRTPNETSTITTAINYTTAQAPATRYCRLEKGQTYWVNLSTRDSATGSPMCNSDADCGFYFRGDGTSSN